MLLLAKVWWPIMVFTSNSERKTGGSFGLINNSFETPKSLFMCKDSPKNIQYDNCYFPNEALVSILAAFGANDP